MERSDVLDAMGKLKLYGMRASYDEIITTARKRQHEPQQIIGDLLTAEISEAGALDQIPDDHRQAPAGKELGVRLRRGRGQRDPGPRPGHRYSSITSATSC
ncbi:MAG: hypothetical protein R3D80_05630 [Paracoccaceae bacterium]